MAYNLCCISEELREKEISFQSMTWKRFCELRKANGESEALSVLGARWLNNVIVVGKTIQQCANNGWGYRVSSSLFPILTHPEFKYEIDDVPQYEAIMGEFEGIEKANKNEDGSQIVRLSTHPDQFNVLASENQLAVDKTIKELNHHGWIMDVLGCERSYWNPINIHINCSRGEPRDIGASFYENLMKCDESVASRLVVENEDKGIWNVKNLVNHIYTNYKIPITFDTLHHKCLESRFGDSFLRQRTAMEICKITWGKIRPIFHYCESDPRSTNPRAHAEMPKNCPPDFPADFDVELKGKCYAIRMIETMGLALK